MPHHDDKLLQDGFQDFVNRCEGAEFEDSVLAQQGKMSLRDLQKMRQSAGNQYATKPASELAMDNRDAWEVCFTPPAIAFQCLAISVSNMRAHRTNIRQTGPMQGRSGPTGFGIIQFMSVLLASLLDLCM